MPLKNTPAPAFSLADRARQAARTERVAIVAYYALLIALAVH